MDSWDYEEFLPTLDYKPGKNGFFDILLPEGAVEPIFKEGALSSRNLNQYLTETRENPATPLTGGLRLIYSSVKAKSPKRSRLVCWSQPDFVQIIDSFRLPKRLTQMIGAGHCMFAQCQPEKSEGETERTSYIFSTMFDHLPFWYLAASWDPSTRITYAFLHSSDPKFESIQRLKGFLAKCVSQVTHPMLLPVLVMDLETNLTLRDDEQWTREIQDIEGQTKQASWESGAFDQENLDFPSTVKKLNGCSGFLSVIERESEAVLLHLDLARRISSNLRTESVREQEVNRTIIRHIDFLVESRKNLLLRLQNVQRRSQIQLAFIYNILAQRNN